MLCTAAGLATRSTLRSLLLPPICLQSDPIRLTASSADRLDIFSLVQTPDEGFNKVICVVAALCDEVKFLRRTVEERFHAPLALFGHSKVSSPC